jgi:hypothetical protein
MQVLHRTSIMNRVNKEINMKKIITLVAFTLLNACSAQLLSRDQVNTVNLLKVSGRVVRYDCDGRVASDRTETLQAPTRWLEWRPEHETQLYMGSFENHSTHDVPMVVDHTKFQITMERNDLVAARVTEGLNTFDYEFRICDEWSAPDPQTNSPTCLRNSTWEEGSFQIEVNYDQKTLDEKTEIRPTPEECQSPNP